MQRIVVANKYTYETDLPVEIGTVVRLPGRAAGSTFDGSVTALESPYDGDCKKVLGIVKTYIGRIANHGGESHLTISDGDKEIHSVVSTQPADTAAAKEWLKNHDPLGKILWST